jgi:hypothetical protein
MCFDIQEPGKVLVFDPVFTEDDVKLLRNLQLNCLADNNACRQLS